jgi:hypothetical protein
MKFMSNAQEKAVVQSRRPETEPVASAHVEETPCVVIRAIDIAFDVPPPRTMHAWLT